MKLKCSAYFCYGKNHTFKSWCKFSNLWLSILFVCTLTLTQAILTVVFHKIEESVPFLTANTSFLPLLSTHLLHLERKLRI
jgi:hypothetical protein